jgi:hypothetical protein
MPRSFAPEASGSLLQKLLFYFGWTGLHNEVPESGIFGNLLLARQSDSLCAVALSGELMQRVPEKR